MVHLIFLLMGSSMDCPDIERKLDEAVAEVHPDHDISICSAGIGMMIPI
jgi:ribose 5-phosphate isomerase RpiB